jgi:hypothetical protein
VTTTAALLTATLILLYILIGYKSFFQPDCQTDPYVSLILKKLPHVYQAVARGVIPPLPYALVGLLYCGIEADRAGAYVIDFTVANKASARVTVQRTVVVQPSCEIGELRCNDGTCGELAGTSV